MASALNDCSLQSIENNFADVINKNSFTQDHVDGERATLKVLFKELSTLYEDIRKEKLNAKMRDGVMDSPGILPTQSSEDSSHPNNSNTCPSFLSERGFS